MASFLCPPRVVVFDFNGTLFDDLHVAYGSVQEIFRTYGVPCPTLEQYREEITSNYMEFYYDYGIPRTAADNDLNAIRNKFYKMDGGNNTGIRGGVIETLTELNSLGARLAIVSAESSVNLYRQLTRAGSLQRFFDFIKPEAWGVKGKEQAFLQVVEIFGIDPSEMVYVDDSVDGLNSAKNVGVTPVAFTNRTGYHSGSRLMSVTEFNIREIRELVNLINPKRLLL